MGAAEPAADGPSAWGYVLRGHGRVPQEPEGRRAVVEIRSVNHRFLDLKLRGASVDPAVEAKAAALEAKVKAGELPATAAAQALLKAFLGGRKGP